MHADLGGLNRVRLVVHRRGRASEIEDLIDLDVEWETDVVARELKAGIGQEMMHIAPRTGIEIVHTQDFIATRQQPIAQVRPDEACSAGDQNTAFSQHGRLSGIPASGRIIIIYRSHGPLLMAYRHTQDSIANPGTGFRVGEKLKLFLTSYDRAVNDFHFG